VLLSPPVFVEGKELMLPVPCGLCCCLRLFLSAKWKFDNDWSNRNEWQFSLAFNILYSESESRVPKEFGINHVVTSHHGHSEGPRYTDTPLSCLGDVSCRPARKGQIENGLQNSGHFEERGEMPIKSQICQGSRGTAPEHILAK